VVEDEDVHLLALDKLQRLECIVGFADNLHVVKGTQVATEPGSGQVVVVRNRNFDGTPVHAAENSRDRPHGVSETTCVWHAAVTCVTVKLRLREEGVTAELHCMPGFGRPSFLPGSGLRDKCLAASQARAHRGLSFSETLDPWNLRRRASPS